MNSYNLLLCFFILLISILSLCITGNARSVTSDESKAGIANSSFGVVSSSVWNSGREASLKADEDCRCKNGYCEKIGGELVCKCNPGWGVVPGRWFDDPYCSKCNCGKAFRCTFEKTYWAITKQCLCSTGYEEIQGVCKATCKKNPCLNEGLCSVNGNDIMCKCKDPFTGEFCQKHLCSPNPCRNRGTCSVDKGKVKCDCKDRFKGFFCEKDICSPNPCKNGGTCYSQRGRVLCMCKLEFTGSRCETKFVY